MHPPPPSTPATPLPTGGAKPLPLLGLTALMRWALWVLQELSEGGMAPSLREIGAELERPPNQVHRLLTALRERGRIDWQPGTARSTRILAPLPFPPGFGESWTISLAPKLIASGLSGRMARSRPASSTRSNG